MEGVWGNLFFFKRKVSPTFYLFPRKQRHQGVEAALGVEFPDRLAHVDGRLGDLAKDPHGSAFRLEEVQVLAQDRPVLGLAGADEGA